MLLNTALNTAGRLLGSTHTSVPVRPRLRRVGAATGHTSQTWDCIKHPAVHQAREEEKEEADGWINSLVLKCPNSELKFKFSWGRRGT